MVLGGGGGYGSQAKDVHSLKAVYVIVCYVPSLLLLSETKVRSELERCESTLPSDINVTAPYVVCLRPTFSPSCPVNQSYVARALTSRPQDGGVGDFFERESHGRQARSVSGKRGHWYFVVVGIGRSVLVVTQGRGARDELCQRSRASVHGRSERARPRRSGSE